MTTTKTVPHTAFPRQGFTLIEVLTAVILLGLMAATITPLVSHVASTPTRVEARLLADQRLTRVRLRDTWKPGKQTLGDVRDGLSLDAEPIACQSQMAVGTGPIGHWWSLTVTSPDGAALAQAIVFRPGQARP